MPEEELSSRIGNIERVLGLQRLSAEGGEDILPMGNSGASDHCGNSAYSNHCLEAQK
ncbi:hypothetical protein ITP53_34355 [Nonomuraea sp. K274]|uniref:Uncharacterized protein n=1 Tax=Nonomuraea cypriaca TaxID=1187855 RepID=A0A931AD01_9ACTN|nr:hypothetical protein [Nonomuraea cypriaca]MBF8190707.1 hypothetical protein [Nonomuraea cypriaca]